MKKSILLLALLSACSYANATTNDVSGVYLGGGFGTTNFDDDGGFGSANVDEDGSTFKLIGGYQFNRIVAVEMQYSKYGDLKVNGPYSLLHGTVEHSSISLAANVGYTFDSGWRPFAIAGLGSIKQSGKAYGLSDSDSGTSFRYGAGVEYTPKALGGLAFRVAYEGDLFVVDSGSNNIDDDYAMTIGTFYAGATYKF
ncbi:porin family protein [Aliivibrio sifiae]|uniref:Membrane protein n=1 Tax=Aliivibrio sifiae TaxID=566293 RepID=A0A2S7XJ08_9GAMM|nr:porin family protein [Aliivibrio sifiae]PQJ93709.1 hypothetical protein BTO23_06360 [Aliivibrio sifiae]GLR74181.1 membrane protein [Aliivibrio sifiae]